MIILLHKPYGMLSQFTPEPGSAHRTLAELGLPADVYAIGRLDGDSEGMLLLSDEGGVNARLLDPEAGHPRTYWVQVEGIPSPHAMDALQRGVPIQGRRTRPCAARIIDPQPAVADRIPPIRERRHIPTTWIELTLTEGKNRQVRRMTAAVGHPTLRLLRVAIGGLPLGDLLPGQWRVLTPAERSMLFG
jgi:23S rRNA pseudouridine2457 synthase